LLNSSWNRFNKDFSIWTLLSEYIFQHSSGIIVYKLSYYKGIRDRFALTISLHKVWLLSCLLLEVMKVVIAGKCWPNIYSEILLRAS